MTVERALATNNYARIETFKMAVFIRMVLKVKGDLQIKIKLFQRFFL